MAVLVAGVSVFAWQSREETIVDSRRDAQATTLFLADHATRLMEAASLALNEAINEIENTGWDEIAGSKSLYLRLRRLRDEFPYIDGIWLNDDTGTLRLSTVDFPTPPSNVADRDFFRAQLDPGASLYISELIQGRVVNKPAFLISRRLQTEDGRFNGIASITLNIGYFEEFYRSVALRNQPTVTLFRAADLSIVAQHPLGEDGKPRQVSDRDALKAALLVAPAAGTFDEVSPADGKPHFTSFRKLGDLPLYVSLSLAHDVMTEAWWARMRTIGFLLIAALMALLGLSLFAFRQSGMERGSRRELEQRVEARTRDLQAANGRMETLFQEVHHRVKNNLQVIVSLLRLQSMRTPDADVRALLQKSIDRVHAMGLVHELLYSSQEAADVDFAQYLRRLSDHLLEAYGVTNRIRVEIQGGQFAFDLNRAVPLALLVNEIFSNAFKYAFPDDRHGRMTIALERIEDQIQLTVHDDGVGVPTGFDWQAQGGLGLRIVKTLARQIGGTAEFGPGKNGGTRFVVAFPAAEPSDLEASGEAA